MSEAEVTLSEWATSVAALPRPLLLAFDVDGTLSPIVGRADEARVPPSVERNLRLLSAVPAVHVAVITGRDLSALQRMLGMTDIYRAVEHGAVVIAPGDIARPTNPDGVLAERLRAFEDWVQRQAVPMGGVLERKRTSRVLHVRALAANDGELANRLLAQAEDVARKLDLHARAGRAVLEAELFPGDKGKALSRIRRVTGARGMFFAGDDYTDEPAIARAVDAGGIGLFVGSPERPTPPASASGMVDSTEQMAALIERLRVALSPPRRLPRGQGGSSGMAAPRLHTLERRLRPLDW